MTEYGSKTDIESCIDYAKGIPASAIAVVKGEYIKGLSQNTASLQWGCRKIPKTRPSQKKPQSLLSVNEAIFSRMKRHFWRFATVPPLMLGKLTEELHTNKGQVDAVIQTDTALFSNSN